MHVCVCVYFRAHYELRVATASGVQPADTVVCVFSNEIYWAPDVPGYEDVCPRFKRVRPAPCQSHSGLLFYCLLPPLYTTSYRWPLNLTTPTPLLSLSHTSTLFYA